jgi:hypothetical protein
MTAELIGENDAVKALPPDDIPFLEINRGQHLKVPFIKQFFE